MCYGARALAQQFRFPLHRSLLDEIQARSAVSHSCPSTLHACVATDRPSRHVLNRGKLLQLIPDELNEEVAQVIMFYRWRRAPILQLLCTLRRQAADGDFIVFASDDGTPLVAMVRLGPSEEDPSATQIVFNVEYRLPTVLVDFVGKLGVHMHVDSILQQNLLVRSSAVHEILSTARCFQ